MNLVKKMQKNSKGFTMAELLIVVAIIAVLVAIAIPTFSAQLTKAKQATDRANCRSYYADLQASFLSENGKGSNSEVTGASSITFTDNTKVNLQAGTITTKFDSTKGWTVTYTPDGGTAENWPQT